MVSSDPDAGHRPEVRQASSEGVREAAQQQACPSRLPPDQCGPDTHLQGTLAALSST